MDVIRIESPEETLTLDVGRITANEWRHIRSYCGHNPAAFFNAIGEIELEAVECLYWLVQKKNQKPLFDIGSKDFAVLDFIEQWQTGEQKSLSASAKEDTDPKDLG